MAIAKDLRAKRAKLVADARALVDCENPTAEALAKFDAMMDEETAIKAQIDRIERSDSLESEMNAGLDSRARNAGRSTDHQNAEEETEGRAFNRFMRFGVGGLNAEEHQILTRRQNGDIRNALGVGSGGSGGYTVPTGFYKHLIDAQLAYGGMLTESTIIDTESGNALPIPTDNDTASVGAIIGENTQVSTQDVSFAAVTLNAYMYTSQAVLVSVQLLQDSAFDLDAFLADKLATRIARAYNGHFTVGTGTGQPTGVITAATLGNQGITGETTSLITDDLINLEHSVDPAYRNGAKFMMHDSTLKIIKKLKDSIGRPLWTPGLAEKEPDAINGYAYTINQSMPVMAASAKSIAFGNLKNYYIRRVNSAISMRLTERYADYGQVGFLLWQRFDGNLVDAGTHPIKYFQNSAT